MHRIAIEGPCCAGKTTLAFDIVAAFSTSSVVVVPDYADVVGGGDGMPEAEPKNLDDELVALEALLEIEARRFAEAPMPAELALIDRSVLTLAAHCAGLERKQVDHTGLTEAVSAVLRSDSRSVWPTHVIYLDIDDRTQAARNCGKFAADSIFVDPSYNAGFRSFFGNLRRGDSTPMVWLDGRMDPGRICRSALRSLDGWLSS